MQVNFVDKRPDKDKENPQQQESINDPQGWAAVRARWAQEQLGKAQARLEKYFNVDEEMPLSRHLLFVSILSFFVVFILWANIAKLDESTRGQGKIIPSGAL